MILGGIDMKKGLLKKLTAVAAVAAITISMIGCGSSKQTGMEKIKSTGKLVVGTSADYPPYEFHATIDGKDEIVGFDMDIAKAVADNLGVELEIKDMDFDGLLVALQANKVDMVFAGMTPTDERKQNADFSDIYYEGSHRFVLRNGEEVNINSFDDLKGKKIGVQKGSIQEGIAKEHFDASDIKSLGKVTDLILDLQNNKVDAILVEEGVANLYCNKNNNIAVAQNLVVTDDNGGVAIAFSKGQSELETEVNKTIKELIESGKMSEYVTKANELAGEQ